MVPCLHTPPDPHTAPAHSNPQQQPQQQQPETSQLEASCHVLSDAVTPAASQDAHMHSPCRSGQRDPPGCLLPHLDQDMHSPQQTEPGSDPMSTSSDSPDRMAAAGPLTQELVVSDSEDEAGMLPLQADSACFSDLMSAQTPPKRLCLNLSPDTSPELGQRAAAIDGVLHSAPPHKTTEGTSTGPLIFAEATAAAETVQQGSYDMLTHDTLSGPGGSPNIVSYHSPALSSRGVEAASGNKTDRLSDPGACMPPLTASIQADADHHAIPSTPWGRNHPGKEGSLPGEACLLAAGNASTLSGSEQQIAPTSAIKAAQKNMPAGSRQPNSQVVSSDQLQQHLLDSHVAHSSVTAFLWSAIRHIVPQVMHQYTHALHPCIPCCPI